MVTVCGTAMWHVCVRQTEKERQREREREQLLIFPFSQFFPPGSITFSHFAALSCLNATCSRWQCPHVYASHAVARCASVCVCRVCVRVCGMCCGKRQLLCDLCGSRQSATGEVAGRQQPSGRARGRERKKERETGEQENCICPPSAMFRLYRFRRSRKVCYTKYASKYGTVEIFLSACNHAAHE